jgi:hypothetical protein
VNKPEHGAMGPDTDAVTDPDAVTDSDAVTDPDAMFLGPLENLSGYPLVEQVQRFGQVHAALQAALAAIDPPG